MPKKKIQSAAQATAEATAPPMSEQELIERLEAEGQTKLSIASEKKPTKKTTEKEPPHEKPKATRKPTKKATAKKTVEPAEKEAPAPQEQLAQEEKAEEVATVRPSKMGQPRKYDEQTKHVSFSLPVSVIENLKIISRLKGMNQTQFILSLIHDETEKEKDRIEAYKKLIQ